MLEAMESMNKSMLVEEKLRSLGALLEQVNSSGDSSWELLQNVYAPHNPAEQGISLALSLTREFLAKHCQNLGACRVHGGGFAGTIQAYIPVNAMHEYRRQIEACFGKGSVTVLNIRPVGVVELNF